MRRHFQRKSHKAGMPPGSVVYVGEEPPEPARITVIDYGPEHFEEREVDRVHLGPELPADLDEVASLDLAGNTAARGEVLFPRADRK